MVSTSRGRAAAPPASCASYCCSAADYFYRVPWLAHVVSLAFNTVPVARKGEGSEAAEGLARLLGEGWSLLLFAEGTRSRDGTVGRLHAGAAVLAAEHRLAIVPVHVSGTHAVMPPWAEVDAARAWPAADLDYTPIAETFRRTIEWAVAEGLVTRPLPRRFDAAI